MAKKGARQIISLDCYVCKNINYTTEKNTLTTKDKLVLKKFCRKCRKHTKHTEGKIK